LCIVGTWYLPKLGVGKFIIYDHIGYLHQLRSSELLKSLNHETSVRVNQSIELRCLRCYFST
jgi:hypothetical protein